MADRLILRPKGDTSEAQRIVDAFAAETGLVPVPTSVGDIEFPLDSPEEHAVPVVQTLTAIDADWAEHLELGDPSNTDRPGGPEA